MSDLERALHELLLEIAAVWREPRLLGSSTRSSPKYVLTHNVDGSIVPEGKQPIRGATGVAVDVKEGMPQGAELAESLVNQALSDPWGYRDDTEVQKARTPINERLEEVFSQFAKVGGLRERLFESFGYKHYEPEEVHRLVERKADEDGFIDRRILWKLLLADSIGRALASLSFDPKRKEEFDEWAAAARLIVHDFESLASRRHHRYRAAICLNAPLYDAEGSRAIAHFRVGEQPIEICLSRATDEFLTQLIRYEYGIPIDQINTVIHFDFTVGVDEPVDVYLKWYPNAAFLAERLTDILRLICTDDVGVLTLEVFSLDWATPTIRKTYERSYSVDLAPYEPKRFRFAAPLGPTLSEAQIEHLLHLAPIYVTDEINVRGLDTAMRRFRASFDRYRSSDPERLLEAAIAFEAILLNDARDNHQELSYRLRLRAARLLAEDLEERIRIFELLRDLYNLRSRIAHGETLGDMKAKDQEKLKAVAQDWPDMLRKLLLKIMQEPELRGLTKEQLSTWWRRIELS